MNDIVFEVLKCVVIVCTITITGYLIPLLKSKVEASKYARILEWVDSAVEWAEQTIKESGKGAEKKEKVIEFVMQYALSKGINITYEQLDVLIESAVNSLKRL